MITFKCEKCGHEYRVNDDLSGRKVRCKSCSTVNVIPEAKAGCGDSLARCNTLLQELLKCEQTAPSVEIKTK